MSPDESTTPNPLEAADHVNEAKEINLSPEAGVPLEADHSKEIEALIRSERGNREMIIKATPEEQGTRLAKGEVSHEMLADDTDLLRMFAEENGMEFVELSAIPDVGKDPKILRMIPTDVAKEFKIFPIGEMEGGGLKVAIADPLNVTVVDNLRLLTGREITPVVATEEEILDRIDLHYGLGDETLEKIVEEIEKDETENVIANNMEVDLSDLEAVANEPTVIKLVNLLLLNIIKDRASDLHIEPFGGSLRIRYRVDGVLRDIPAPPKSLQAGLLSRFKVMSNMNIAETRRPQDGRIRLTMSGREVDLRVSTLPTVHGESMVMRVLDKSMMMLGLDQIGMGDQCLENFRKVIKKPNGIILVTGPTGSGKTTTLYAAIQDINDPGEKIITTEDPVEYQVPGLVQININEKVGLTFAACLRAILRQDPDTILVGEIRDVETAQIAVQASLTGHLVFSTLHTNSAAATISRLIDMGVEPFLLTSTLEAVIGQRLVRTVCPSCGKPYSPTAEELLDFGQRPEDCQGAAFMHGDGCDDCNHSGYKGRLGLFEVLLMSDPLRDLILEHSTADEIQAQAIKEGLITMRQDGWDKIKMGVTSIHEVAHHAPAGEAVSAGARETEESRRTVHGPVTQAQLDAPQQTSPHITAGEEAAPPGSQPQPWEDESGKPLTPPDE